MKILYLSLGEFDNLESGSVHIDLLKCLAKTNDVYLVCKREKRQKLKTELTREYKINVLRVKTGNLKNVNIIEKGLSTIMVEFEFLRAIKQYFSDVRFDLVLYSTPPITFEKPIQYIKRRDNAKTYLMLKDIFPQNAVDLGMLSYKGMKGLVYRYFRKKEKKLYKISDYIGCMSPANCKYIQDNNPEITRNKIGLCPNSIYVSDMRLNNETKMLLREQYGLPQNKRIFIYGGNLGKPQGVDFIMKCLNRIMGIEDVFFLIIGKGTEYQRLNNFVKTYKPSNIKVMQGLPKNEYDRLVGACDIGLIFLDYRFTIPNFPARTLSYMQAGLPILAATDNNTDVGTIISEAGFGWWCESNDVKAFVELVNYIKTADLSEMQKVEWEYLNKNYSVEVSYKKIMQFVEGAV